MINVCLIKGSSETAITDMQTYMDMLNPDITAEDQNKKGPSSPPPPPAFPPPPPPGPSQIPPPPPTYPAPNLSKEESAEFLKVKSKLRHVDNDTVKKEVCDAVLSLSLFFNLKHIMQ